MPRGGRRSGKSGVAYGQRTDLAQAPKTVPGQAYGMAQQQRQAQQALPIAGTQVPAPSTPPGAASGPVPGGEAPPDLGPFGGPSNRPTEPVQHGMPMGPGGGPEVLGPGATPNGALEMQLRAIYSVHPTEQLRALIEQIETGNDR